MPRIYGDHFGPFDVCEDCAEVACGVARFDYEEVEHPPYEEGEFYCELPNEDYRGSPCGVPLTAEDN